MGIHSLVDRYESLHKNIKTTKKEGVIFPRAVLLHMSHHTTHDIYNNMLVTVQLTQVMETTDLCASECDVYLLCVMCSPGDQLWGIPVVLYMVWTVVLMVSSFIVLSCLQRETKKFHKRLTKLDSKEDLVTDMRKLEAMMAR